MSYDYNGYYSQTANLLVVSTAASNPTLGNFNTMLSGAIDYAEQRIYRELDLLVTRVTDSSASATPNVRNFTLPISVGTYLVVEQINIITPSTALSSNGQRVPLVNTSRDFIDVVYPSNLQKQMVPQFFAMQDNANIILGPAPDRAYAIEVIGTQRPTPLSSVNTTTFLTQTLPDLFMAASMVYAYGYQRDFSAQSDDPRASQSWENQFQTLLKSANLEELRKRYFSAGWTDKVQSPVAGQRT